MARHLEHCVVRHARGVQLQRGARHAGGVRHRANVDCIRARRRASRVEDVLRADAVHEEPRVRRLLRERGEGGEGGVDALAAVLVVVSEREERDEGRLGHAVRAARLRTRAQAAAARHDVRDEGHALVRQRASRLRRARGRERGGAGVRGEDVPVPRVRPARVVVGPPRVRRHGYRRVDEDAVVVHQADHRVRAVLAEQHVERARVPAAAAAHRGASADVRHVDALERVAASAWRYLLEALPQLKFGVRRVAHGAVHRDPNDPVARGRAGKPGGDEAELLRVGPEGPRQRGRQEGDAHAAKSNAASLKSRDGGHMHARRRREVKEHGGSRFTAGGSARASSKHKVNDTSSGPPYTDARSGRERARSRATRALTSPLPARPPAPAAPPRPRWSPR